MYVFDTDAGWWRGSPRHHPAAAAAPRTRARLDDFVRRNVKNALQYMPRRKT